MSSGPRWLGPLVLATSIGCAPQVLQLAAGRDTTCARVSSGDVRCWGDNSYGQLGNGQLTQPLAPVAVVGLHDAINVAVGEKHACAVRAAGTVVCWGANDERQLGDGTQHPSAVPVAVKGVDHAVEVAAGFVFTCARLSSGQVRCWGTNSYGSLGDGTTENPTTAVAVAGVEDAVRVTAEADGGQVCALRRGGGVTCWGSDSDGELGERDDDRSWGPPGPVPRLDDAVELVAGAGYTCARRRAGQVVCWGTDQRGQLGDGQPAGPGTRRPEPEPVVDLPDAVGLAAGDGHVCARRRGGAVVCWGDNDHGQLGRPSDVWPQVRPKPVPIADAVELALGETHSCARLRSGAVVCWGRNDLGQLGDGTDINRTGPAPVRGIIHPPEDPKLKTGLREPRPGDAE